MYFVIGWPQTLVPNENVHSIIPNRDNTIFIFLSNDSLSLWYCRPAVQILLYKRALKCLKNHGENVAAVWKSDSSQIIIQTSSDHLLFFQVVINNENDNILRLIQNSNESNVEEPNRIPAYTLEFEQSVFIQNGITSLMSAEEELVLTTKNGQLIGVHWDGQLDENLSYHISIPANYFSLTTSNRDDQISICDFKYSTSIGGFSLVFSNGLGGFLPFCYPTAETNNHLQVELISQVDNAVCTAINHRFALIAFGLSSSTCVLCTFDEIDHRFIISHQLSLPSNTFPGMEKHLGAITALQWTPDSNVLATAWNNGGFALWTVFGSLLSCSLTWDYSSMTEIETKHILPFRVTSFAFGQEGFHLWAATIPSTEIQNVNCDNQHTNSHSSTVCKFSLVKSVLAANPCSSVSVETVLLASEDRIFVGGNKSSNLYAQHLQQFNEDYVQSMNNGKCNNTPRMNDIHLIDNPAILTNQFSEHESNAVDSFQWLTVPMPQSYLESNWPIRYFAIDPCSSQNLAIAGANGLALYSLIHRKWKSFGNENHERDFIITGGFLWFYDYIIGGCYNTLLDCYEIRAYSFRDKLDNENVKIVSVDKDVYQLSLHRNRLLALCSDGTILLFDLHIFMKTGTTELNISSPIRVIINNSPEIIIPECVTVCLLTDLHVDIYHNTVFHHNSNQTESSHHRSQMIQTSAASRSHSILLNIRGRVLLFEMDVDTTGLPLSSDEDDDDDDDNYYNDNDHERENDLTKHHNTSSTINKSKPNTIKYRKVANLATNVENLWILPHNDVQLNAFRPTILATMATNCSQQQRPHLVTSLYLSCGSSGMAIWLSLEHSIRPQLNQSNTQKRERQMINNRNGTEMNSLQTDDHAYISKRIMLPIHELAFNIYPLAIRFREAIVLGAESHFTQPNSFQFFSSSSTSSSSSNTIDSTLYIPFGMVKRTSQVYLHYILQELLRRNLGYRAWEIANTCTALPHFVHSLELLLHGVLEEETSSSHPIPDALLPRVVDFIRAFPVFLQTVIHCTRKTELALWPDLFKVVGSPKDLFQQCLLEGQLETAASYIIVLQNLEKAEVASRCASKLLQAASIAGSWVTVKELKRFLRATNYAEENGDTETNNHVNGNNINDNYGSSHQNSNNQSVMQPTTNNSNSISRSNSIESSAKNSSLTSLPTVHPQGRPTLPGAAIKQSGNMNEIPFVEKSHQNHSSETNIVMRESIVEEQFNHLKGDDDDDDENFSIGNNSDDQQTTTENFEITNSGLNAKNGENYRNYYQRTTNGRAYPGGILRMDNEHHPNAPFQFLNTSSFVSVASSISSISSLSSISSSAISSASVSPTMNKNRIASSIVPIVDVKPNLFTNDQKFSHIQNERSINGHDGSKMLKAVPLSVDESSQCIIA